MQEENKKGNARAEKPTHRVPFSENNKAASVKMEVAFMLL